jgi:MYXO-CTERM domain-containing protein
VQVGPLMLLAPRTVVVAGAAIAALSLAACGQGGPGGGTEDERVDESASALTANDKLAFDYFLVKGLTPVQAAGIVGNLDQESNMNPGAVQPGGPGRGIAQWSVGGRWNADPGDNAVAYAASHGKSVTSLGLQLDFIWFELTTFSGYGLSALKKSTTTSAATLAFMTDFEACGTCLSSQRISYAQAALAAYGKDHVDAGADAAVAMTPDASKADGSANAHGEDGGADAPSTPAADDAGVGATSAAQEVTAAEVPAEDPGADPGGCSTARAPSTSSRTGVNGTWLAVLGVLAALHRRRRIS